MAGFPVVPSLLALGPRTFKDEGVSLNSDYEISAVQLNLWKWQLAGIGIVSPKAWVKVNNDGTLAGAGAVWNPEGDVSLHPVTARPSTGVYTVTWAAQYQDELGTLRDVTLIGGMAYPQGAVANIVATASVLGTVCTALVATGNTGASVNSSLLIMVM